MWIDARSDLLACAAAYNTEMRSITASTSVASTSPRGTAKDFNNNMAKFKLQYKKDFRATSEAEKPSGCLAVVQAKEPGHGP
jgi:hypothetical protein